MFDLAIDDNRDILSQHVFLCYVIHTYDVSMVSRQHTRMESQCCFFKQSLGSFVYHLSGIWTLKHSSFLFLNWMIHTSHCVDYKLDKM